MAIWRAVLTAAVLLTAAAGCGSPQTERSAFQPPAVAPSVRSGVATGAGGVRLHYLDFGGTGLPMVLLSGAGNTAWIYGDLGTQLARDHRVFALTRRGHGESDQPESGYDVPTLAADLRAFLDEMKLERVVLVGHSLAGVELTYFATQQPDRVAAVVYLDAAYDRAVQGPVMEAAPYTPPAATDADRASVASFTAYVRSTRPDLARYPKEPVDRDLRASIVLRPDGTAGWRAAPIFGEYWMGASSAAPEYGSIKAPILAIYAIEDPRNMLPADASDVIRVAQQQYEEGPIATWRNHSIAQLKRAQPSAQVVEMRAGHHVFLDRGAETLEAIRAFIRRNFHAFTFSNAEEVFGTTEARKADAFDLIRRARSVGT